MDETHTNRSRSIMGREEVVMKSIYITLALLMFAPVAHAQRDIFEASPKYRNTEPDGRSNPYIIRDRYGRRVGEVRVKHYDSKRDDGFNDPGSRSNPYIFEKSNRKEVIE